MPSITSRRQAVTFCHDFFFTDIMNHLEFLKWTGTLEKDDDILLIQILERLVNFNTPLVCMQEPYFYYGSIVPEHCPLPKNALHVATAYAQIQRLAGMEFNIFEFAYLDPQSYQLRAWLAFIIQVGFFSCLLVYNVFENRIEITPGEEGFSLVVVILFMSSVLLFSEVTRQRSDAADFNHTMLNFGSINTNSPTWNLVQTRKIWLHINYIINDLLGILVFFFNIYFILVSDNPTEAVLNSVALAFIIEVDDAFRPTWNESDSEDALAEMLQHYIMEEEVSENDINVQVKGESGEVLKCDRKVYIHLEDYDDDTSSFQVQVFIAAEPDPETHLTLRYDSILYTISGMRSNELYEAFSDFHCLENLQDIADSYNAGCGGHGVIHQRSSSIYYDSVRSNNSNNNNNTNGGGDDDNDNNAPTEK